LSLFELVSISFALSLDAFGVAISLGFKHILSVSKKMLFIASFGFFQFFLSFCGLFIGKLFNQYVFMVPSYLSGVIVLLVGIFMIKEAIQNKKQESIIMNKAIFIILGISVSVDALMIGFTVISRISFLFTGFTYTLFIGFVTLIMTFSAFLAAFYLKRIEIIERYSEYIGGIILILFAIKMIILG